MCADLIASIEKYDRELIVYLSELQQDSDKKREKQKLLRVSRDSQDASDVNASKARAAAAGKEKQQTSSSTGPTGPLEIRTPRESLQKVRLFALLCLCGIWLIPAHKLPILTH
jgi:hypothetical protein